MHSDNSRGKFDKLLNYAATIDKFSWIYRVEGPLNIEQGSGKNTHLKGTWYTESWQAIQGTHKPKIKKWTKGGEPDVYALLIPQEMLDQRGVLEKGMQEINIVNPALTSGRIKLEDTVNLENNKFPEPNANTYIKQFDFAKKYLK